MLKSFHQSLTLVLELSTSLPSSPSVRWKLFWMRCWRSYQRSTTCPTSPRRRLNAPRTSWSASRSANAWTHSSLRCGARSRSSTSGSRCACIVFACICTVKLCALCDAIVKFVFQRVNWPSPLRWRSCRRPCSSTTSLIPGPSWPTPPPTAWLYGVCVCVVIYFLCPEGWHT